MAILAASSFSRQFSWLMRGPVPPVSLYAGLSLLHHPRFRFFSQSARPESVQGQATVSCDENGRKMTVRWPDGEESVFHAVWLRHSCQCSECVQHSSGQRLVTSSVLGGGLKISKARVQGIGFGSWYCTVTLLLVYTLCLSEILPALKGYHSSRWLCASNIGCRFNWSIEIAKTGFPQFWFKFQEQIIGLATWSLCFHFYYPHSQHSPPSVNHMAPINVVQLRYITFLIVQ